MNYAIAHKPVSFIPPDSKGYALLQVGTGCHPFCELADNQGDNISDKNSTYCELTGLYWMWKNQQQDKIIGLVHYRRYFVNSIFCSIINGLIPLNMRLITLHQAERILNRYDIILPEKWAVDDTSVWDHYAHNHRIKDMISARHVIEEKYPEYIPAFDSFMSQREMHACNMFICSRQTFTGLCEWLFDILFEVEKGIDLSTYSGYQLRVFGFLAERLVNVYYIHNNLKSYIAPIQFIKDA